MGLEVLITTTPSDRDGQTTSVRIAEPVNPFTLRGLYVRTSISGNSVAAELGRYLNINETTFSSSSKENSPSNISSDERDIHEEALSAILDDVTSCFNTTFEYVRVSEPQGGVQEWWARMLSGFKYNSQPASGCQAIGESQ